MTIQQLVGTYVQLRQELERAFVSKAWKPRRQGHIRRLSRELGQVEEQLQQANVSDDLFVALVVGHADAPPLVALARVEASNGQQLT